MKPTYRMLAALLMTVAGLVQVHAATPVCTAPAIKASWPVADPVWEFCFLRPSQSSAVDGSSLELRDVHYNGRLVLKRAHSPILFAEYASQLCYRDWKNTNVSFIAPPSVRAVVGVPTFTVKQSCDVSTHPTSAFGNCPFGQGNPPGDCFSGVSLEDRGNSLVVSTQHSAAWYQYSSRFFFYPDGSFEPEFGFGNSDGTNSDITHWHHNYWRLDFDIEGSANDVIAQNDVVQPLEFSALRCNGGTTPSCATERNWSVTDTVTGRGYRVLPSAEDYITPTNQSGLNHHRTDVIGTIYVAGEYADQPDNDLQDCTMAHSNLTNGGDLNGATDTGTDVVLYYRSGVRDLTGVDSMVCKKAGPVIVPIGDWSPAPLFASGFE
jgi:hypothetical protein